GEMQVMWDKKKTFSRIRDRLQTERESFKTEGNETQEQQAEIGRIAWEDDTIISSENPLPINQPTSPIKRTMIKKPSRQELDTAEFVIQFDED
ncbi:MAG: hypothetical protein MI922_28420, partial [Bacteroidales bacterium]|nr:hypothetical protein [Bacteroidales bacterium]